MTKSSLRRNWLMLVGLGIVLVVVAISVLAPLIAPQDPLQQSIDQRLQPPGFAGRFGIDLLGTDQLGRDVLSRIMYGGRISLLVGCGSVFFAAIIGTFVGLVAGYNGGWVDSLAMRLVDLVLAFPYILLALAILALLGASVLNIILVLAITGWPIYARTVRASALSIKKMEFVEAARCLGAPGTRILFRHVLPNAVSPLIVISSFQLAHMIILESALGFLGVGIGPPTPTWGNMLGDGRAYLTDSWWLAAFPGLAIMVTAAGINFIGDGLRDLLDPRSQRT